MQFQVTPMDDGIRAGSDELSLENAIRAAAENGCRRVVIPGDKTWTLTKPCRVPSEFVVELDGCRIETAGQPAFINEFADAENPSLATENHDIVICGSGKLVGGGVQLFNVKDFRLAGFTVEGAKEAVRLEYCYGGFVDDLELQGAQGIIMGCGVHDMVTNHISGRTADSFLVIGETEATPVLAKPRNISDLLFTGVKAEIGAGALCTFRALREGVFKTVLISEVEITGSSKAAFRFTGETTISGVTADAVTFGGCGALEIAAPIFQCAFLRLEKGSRVTLPEAYCKDVLVQEV